MFKQLCNAYATQKKKFRVSKQNLASLLISTINQADFDFEGNTLKARSFTLPKCIVY